MKKIIVIALLFLFLIGSGVVNAEEQIKLDLSNPQPIENNPRFQIIELTPFQKFLQDLGLFTVVVVQPTPSSPAKIGDKIDIAADEIADSSCSKAELRVQIKNGNGVIIDYVTLLTKDNVIPGQTLQRAVSDIYTIPAGEPVGTWAAKSFIVCPSKGTIISSSSVFSFPVVAGGFICTTKLVGDPFCSSERDALYQYEQQNLGNNVCVQAIQVIDDCKASGKICSVTEKKCVVGNLCGNKAVDFGETCENCVQDYPISSCDTTPTGGCTSTQEKCSDNVCRTKGTCPLPPPPETPLVEEGDIVASDVHQTSVKKDSITVQFTIENKKNIAYKGIVELQLLETTKEATLVLQAVKTPLEKVCNADSPQHTHIDVQVGANSKQAYEITSPQTKIITPNELKGNKLIRLVSYDKCQGTPQQPFMGDGDGDAPTGGVIGIFRFTGDGPLCTTDYDCILMGTGSKCSNPGDKEKAQCSGGVGEGKILSLTFDEWKDTTAKQRINTVCTEVDQCAAYEDLENPDKKYKVACKGNAQVVAQLEEDSKKVCNAEGLLQNLWHLFRWTVGVPCKDTVLEDGAGACIATTDKFDLASLQHFNLTGDDTTDVIIEYIGGIVLLLFIFNMTKKS